MSVADSARGPQQAIVTAKDFASRHYLFFLGLIIWDCAAERMAIGTLKGEQET